MKEIKKAIIEILKKKNWKKNEKFENRVLNLALQKIDSDSFEYDGEGVYTADGQRIVYCMTQADSFTIQAGTVVVGEMAFRGKNHLKSVIIPDSVTTIERDAFYDCDALTSVYLPTSVKTVKGYAFAECDQLKTVTFRAVPEKLSRHAFDDCDQLREVFIPEGSLAFFQKALHYDESEADFLFRTITKEKTKTTAKANLTHQQRVVKVAEKKSAEKNSAEKATENNPIKPKQHDERTDA